MGLITGIRIVNMRVRDKVAYPDVTIDFAGEKAAHLVVGLENGGGKSTLLGALYHVFAPEADEFLPRRSMKRQGKKGEVKRIEHYVPGGDPTHFIVEVEVPNSDGTLGLVAAPRLLLGACLWKPAGAPPSAPVKEFFWSARSVTRELTLRELNFRGDSGRLLDHREFKAKLNKHLRVDVPAAQINIEDLQGSWDVHLQSLGVDVEFIRQFLLRMNEDEGAADQVFTYASSREFLESLVGVVGDPRAISRVKKSLAELASDADGILVDRQRVKLLEGLAVQTGAFVEHMRTLGGHLTFRGQMVDSLIRVRGRVSFYLENTREQVARAKARRARVEGPAADAWDAFHEANARFVLARVQVAEWRHKMAVTMTELAEDERRTARSDERVAHVCALLADRRTAEARIIDVQELLRKTSIEAEPLRLACSSAVQALRHRLASDRVKLEAERASLDSEVLQAAADLRSASAEVSTAERRLGRLDGEQKTLSSERAEIDRQLIAAKENGLLPDSGIDPSAEAGHARRDAATEHSTAESYEQQRLRAIAELDRLRGCATQLTERATRAAVEIETAKKELDGAVCRTEELTVAIEATGDVEIHPILLDSHADAVGKRLKQIVESARFKQAAAAVRAANADRSATWLSEHDRLPPRAEVERLCDQLLADGYGARPGWAYLSALPPAVASKFAEGRPGLADGIVVNIPEDFDKVVRTVSAVSDEITSPIEIGSPAAFEDINDQRKSTTIVMPHAAHWSTAAGKELSAHCIADAKRWREEYERETDRGYVAVQLDGQLGGWMSDIGLGGISVRGDALAKAVGALGALVGEQKDLEASIAASADERDVADSARRAAEGRGSALLGRALQLDALAGIKTRLMWIDARLTSMQDEQVAATALSGTASDAVERARQRGAAAQARIERLAELAGELNTAQGEIAGLAEVAVQSGDPIALNDQAADRELLTRQVHDRVNRWRGSITDPELRAELRARQDEIEELEIKLRRDPSSVVDLARALVAKDAELPAEAYRTEEQTLRERIETLRERIGGLKTAKDQREQEMSSVSAEFNALRRPVRLAGDEIAADLDAAEAIRARLESARDHATSLRNGMEAERRAAENAETYIVGRAELLEQADKRLGTITRRLAVGGVLVPTIEISERTVDLEADVGLPEDLATLIRIAGRPLGDAETSLILDADRVSTSHALEGLEERLEVRQREMSAKETRAVEVLDATEALLRNASEKVVRGDQMIHVLRAAPRPSLAELAVAHHSDILQRLSSTQHHVSKFHARLDSRAETIYATIAGLLREVRHTVRDSQLPNTPAMGRWAGAELLKFTGLETLRVDEKRAAISAMLRVWFDPERPDIRPKLFDSDSVVNELVRAVTPQFTARILIPSDPLDPDHKPVEHLALETSGGEGVTVALIIASLLASRRALTRGHRRTSLVLDNPFAKVTKPEFLRLARDVASELGVQIVALTGIRDLAALMVFPRLIQLRVSRRETANFVVPQGIEDDLLQPLLRNGTLYVSPLEWNTGLDAEQSVWPVMSAVSVVDQRDSHDRST